MILQPSFTTIKIKRCHQIYLQYQLYIFCFGEYTVYIDILSYERINSFDSPIRETSFARHFCACTCMVGRAHSIRWL